MNDEITAPTKRQKKWAALHFGNPPLLKVYRTNRSSLSLFLFIIISSFTLFLPKITLNSSLYNGFPFYTQISPPLLFHLHRRIRVSDPNSPLSSNPLSSSPLPWLSIPPILPRRSPHAWSPPSGLTLSQ